MFIIHFTSAAADPLRAFDATAASFLPLAKGKGDTHISCLHLERDGKIQAPSISHSAALFCIHGCLSVKTPIPETQISLHAGMGAVFSPNEPYTLKSDTGAILLIVESQELTAHARAISTPQPSISTTGRSSLLNSTVLEMCFAGMSTVPALTIPLSGTKDRH